MLPQDTLKINEIFYSIQGEGHNTGRPAIFVRFAGCNLSCDFCDTRYADYYFNLSIGQIIYRIKQYPVKFVIFTGGEPTIQNIEPLWRALKTEDYEVAIETNGTNPISIPFDWITVSPKEEITQINGNELKVVYRGEDIEFLRTENPYYTHYYAQPCSGENIAETVEFVKANPGWRLSLQCHKIINIR